MRPHNAYLRRAGRILAGKGDAARENELARRAWNRLSDSERRASLAAVRSMMGEHAAAQEARDGESAMIRRDALLDRMVRAAFGRSS